MVGLILLAVFLLLGVLFYALSVSSRKSYHCPTCGEVVKVEHMNAHHCGMCGAPLKED